MAGFIRDFIQGSAQAVPGAVKRANDFEQKAQIIAAREQENKTRQASVDSLNDLRKQQKDANSLNLTMKAMTTPNKSLQKFIIDNQVKNQEMSKDFGDALLKSSDEARIAVGEMIADGKITPQEQLVARQGGFEETIQIFLDAEKLGLEKEQTRANTNLLKAKTAGVKQETQSTGETQRILAQPQATSQPISQGPSPQLTQFLNNTSKTLGSIDKNLGLQGGALPSVNGQRPASAQSPVNNELQRLRSVENRLIQANTKSSRAALVGVQKKITSLINARKKNTVVRKDSLGNLARFDLNTGDRLPLDSGVDSARTGDDLINDISRSRRTLLITPSQIITGTGLASNIRESFSNLVGTFNFGVSGQIAPATVEAKNAIRSFNQMVKNDLTINARNPIAELKTIEDFLVDPDKRIQDPDANITKTINLIKRFESDVIKFQDALNRRGLSASQAEEFTNKVNNRLGILSQMPTITQLKIQTGLGIDVEDVERMSLGEIDEFPEDQLTNDVAKAMLKRANTLLRKR